MAIHQSLAQLSILLFIFICSGPIIAIPCYSLDGRQANPDVQACNTNATGRGGIHSACCKVKNQDACLSTGLCLNTLARQSSHFLWATGCTDPTFLDPSCPKYCRATGWNNARLQNCNDTHYCCAKWDVDRDPAACCNSSFPLDEPIGTITRQIFSTDANLTGTPKNATSSNDDTMLTCPDINIPTRAAVGLSVEGGALLITFIALGYLLWSRKRLKEEIEKFNRVLTASEPEHVRQVRSYHPSEISELPVNPQELPAPNKPLEVYGGGHVSQSAGWYRTGVE